MPKSGPALLSLDRLAPRSVLLQAARQLAWMGAFTQADIGAVVCRGATTPQSRAVLAQRLRQKLEKAKWIEPYTATDATGLRAPATREGSRVFRLTSLARRELLRTDEEAVPANAFAANINRVLAERSPPEQLPRKGVMLANRWLYANCIAKDGVNGLRWQGVGEYALRGELKFANPHPGWDTHEVKNLVDRMPDGVLLALQHVKRGTRVVGVALESLTLVEIERRFEDVSKHFRLFLHFDANGELRPLHSAVFKGLTNAKDSDDTEGAVVVPSLIQVVRIVERTTGAVKRRPSSQTPSGEAVTASLLVDLAKVFFFGATLIPPSLRSDRTDRLAKELHRSGMLDRRAFVTSPTEASVERFLWMLEKIEIVTVTVNGRHGTLTDDIVYANGALRQDIRVERLSSVFQRLHPSELEQRELKEPQQQTHTKVSIGASDKSSQAQANPNIKKYWAMVLRIVQSQVMKIGRAGLEGSDKWAQKSDADLESLAALLAPIMVDDRPQTERQPLAAQVAHRWLTGEEEEGPDDASLEVGYRCVFVFDNDLHRQW